MTSAVPSSSRLPASSRASSMAIEEISAMVRPPTVTASASGRKRVPSQARQARLEKKRA